MPVESNSNPLQTLILLARSSDNIPVVSWDNTLISNTWAGLWDGGIEGSLHSAGVVSTSWWWSGTNIDGTKRDSCNNFTSSEQDTSGSLGLATGATSTGESWILGTSSSCTLEAQIVCVAH